ncbi:hypothetical protein BM1_10517 [Bipolaris maydis]|nr:hypothetical protein BM1_10517 [Bipolaris maydis]
MTRKRKRTTGTHSEPQDQVSFTPEALLLVTTRLMAEVKWRSSYRDIHAICRHIENQAWSQRIKVEMYRDKPRSEVIKRAAAKVAQILIETGQTKTHILSNDDSGMPIQPTTRLSSVIQRQGLVNSDVSLNSNPEALPSPKSATPLHTNLSASLTSSSEPQPTPPTATASALPEAITSLTHIRPSERDNNQADAPSRRRVFPLSIPSLPSYKRPTPPPLLQEPTNSTPTREDTTKPRATLEAQKHQTANSQQYSVYNNARRLPLSILLDSTVDGSSNTTDSNTTTVVQQADIPVRIQQQRTRSTAFSLQSRQALPSQSRKPSMSRSRLPSYIEISDSDSDYENESDDENESDVRTTSHSNILANTRTHNTVDRTRNISFTRLSTIAKEKSMSSQQQCDGGEKENQDPTTVASSSGRLAYSSQPFDVTMSKPNMDKTMSRKHHSSLSIQSAENHANPFMSAIRPKDLGENTYRVDGQDGAVINNDIRETGLHLGSKDNNVSNVSFKDGVVRFVWSPPRVCAQDVFDPSFHLRHNGTDMLSMPGNPSCKLQYITVHDCLKVHTNGLNGSDSTKKRIQFLQKMFTSTPRAIQLRMSGAIGLTDTKSISVNLGDHTFWFNTALTEMRVDAVTQFVEGSHTRMLNIITIKMFPDMYNTDEERIQANCKWSVSG